MFIAFLSYIVLSDFLKYMKLFIVQNLYNYSAYENMWKRSFGGIADQLKDSGTFLFHFMWIICESSLFYNSYHTYIKIFYEIDISVGVERRLQRPHYLKWLYN